MVVTRQLEGIGGAGGRGKNATAGATVGGFDLSTSGPDLDSARRSARYFCFLVGGTREALGSGGLRHPEPLKLPLHSEMVPVTFVQPL